MKTSKPSRKAQINQRLEELAAANRGKLTPAIVIADARHARSPLHASFAWDTKIAAMKYWEEQARELIRNVRIEVRTRTHIIRAPRYIHCPRAGTSAGYVETISLKSSRDIALEALQYELDRALSALERAQEVAAVLGLDGEIARFLNGLRTLKEVKAAKAA